MVEFKAKQIYEGALRKELAMHEVKTAHKKKRLPISTDNFEQVRNENLYYVDKTALVEQLLNNWAEVTLFTRPRRFGKSLNMSMLRHFFEIGSDLSLFDGLTITQRTDLCEQYMGKYPVISLTLKDVNGLNFESAYDSFCRIIQSEALRHYYLKDSDVLLPKEKEMFKSLLSDNPKKENIKNSLQILSALLEKHYSQKTIILIDEYDVPLDKAYLNGYYDEMLDLIRALFDSVLKSNTSLQFAILTGCLRVSKESVFTGLTNFRVCDVSDLKFAEYFGFTQNEVEEMFEYYGFENRLKDAKMWYDGYHFGDKEMYCPWDVMSFCDDLQSNSSAEPRSYWINTSGNDIVRQLIERNSTDFVKADIEALIAGKTIEKKLNLNITHREINYNINNLWSLLYMTGYLTTTKTPSKGMCTLCIPNYEINLIFQDQVQDWFDECMYKEAREKSEKLERLYKAFETGDASTVEELLNERLLTTISFSDAYEGFYHGFLVGILNARPVWGTSSNSESGHGKSDIILKSAGNKFGAVIEIKRLPAGEFDKLNHACEQALQQIEDRQYTTILKQESYTQIYKYGIAFCVKKCRVVCEKELV